MPRINTNIPSMKAHRYLQNANAASDRNLERLSSGLKINQAADGPASLVVSERMRAQISSLGQAIENSENGVSLTQTAEGALTEINRILNNMRQLAVHASNDGVNDEQMLAADQAEMMNSIKTIERIATNTQFGTKHLLDGTRGANGVATGDHLQFVAAGEGTQSSPKEGYQVTITQAASRATRKGEVALSQALINAGETLTLTEGGRTIQLKTDSSMTPESVKNQLQQQANEAGLKLKIDFGMYNSASEADSVAPGNRLRIQHTEYGSDATFTAVSSTAGVLSKAADAPLHVNNGADVAGEIAGEEAFGRGQVLTGKPANGNTAGLAVRYTGDRAPLGGNVGSVTVAQNSLIFQIGANVGQKDELSLRDMKPAALGTGVTNGSNYNSIADIDLTNFQGAQDAINLLDKAIQETSMTRANIGAFQKNTLESNLSFLRIAAENVTASESVIRDADFAKEMASFTRNQIVQQSATSMLAQANQSPRNVLSLIS